MRKFRQGVMAVAAGLALSRTSIKSISLSLIAAAGYDGDIENFEEKQTLIQNQSRLLSETQTAFGWENDQAGTGRVLKRLGLWNEDGHPNMDVIKSFGNYTQRHYASGSTSQVDLVDYLHKQNPEHVKPLTDIERETTSLEFEVLKTNQA